MRQRGGRLAFWAALLAAGLALPALAGTPADNGGAPPTRAAATAPRKRVAVVAFEYGTVQRWWSGNWDLGRGISDLLVSRLVADGKYSVVERQALAAVIDEQDLGRGGRIDPATAAKIGKILGVDAVIVGSITQFGFDDKSVGLGGFGDRVAHGLLANVKVRQAKAVVRVDARLIDTTSGEVLAVASGKGESRRGSLAGLGEGWDRGGRTGGGFDMTNQNFQDTILGEATRKCVEGLGKDLNRAEPKVVVKAARDRVGLTGKVADVDGATVTVNIGADKGVAAGDELVVERVVRVIKDPDTGEVLREVTEPVGTVRVTQVEGRAAVGTFVGAGSPQAGDRVRPR